MAMTNRNTRAMHTADKRIRASLDAHNALMAHYVAQGVDQTEASRLAMNVLMATRAVIGKAKLSGSAALTAAVLTAIRADGAGVQS